MEIATVSEVVFWSQYTSSFLERNQAYQGPPKIRLGIPSET
jgi:hypothetical protein